MVIWKYRIQTNHSTIITQNFEYAEKRSRLGDTVFCRRESNILKYYR